MASNKPVITKPVSLQPVCAAQPRSFARGFSLSINRRGSGAANATRGSELTRSAGVLLPPLMNQTQDLIIANDSQASICMFPRYVTCPQTLQQCKYKVLLENVVTRLPIQGKKGPANYLSESEVPNTFWETRRLINWPQPVSRNLVQPWFVWTCHL